MKLTAEHDGFIWAWDEEDKEWLIDLEESGGPPSPHQPSPKPPTWKPNDDRDFIWRDDFGE